MVITRELRRLLSSQLFKRSSLKGLITFEANSAKGVRNLASGGECLLYPGAWETTVVGPTMRPNGGGACLVRTDVALDFEWPAGTLVALTRGHGTAIYVDPVGITFDGPSPTMMLGLHREEPDDTEIGFTINQGEVDEKNLSASGLTAGCWRIISGDWGPLGMRLWLNGTLVDSGLSTTVDASGEDICIGNIAQSVALWAMWDEQLHAAELRKIAAALAAGNPILYE